MSSEVLAHIELREPAELLARPLPRHQRDGHNRHQRERADGEQQTCLQPAHHFASDRQ